MGTFSERGNKRDMGQLRNVNTLRSTLHSDYVEKQESAVYYDARSKDFPQRRRGGGGATPDHNGPTAD